MRTMELAAVERTLGVVVSEVSHIKALFQILPGACGGLVLPHLVEEVTELQFRSSANKRAPVVHNTNTCRSDVLLVIVPINGVVVLCGRIVGVVVVVLCRVASAGVGQVDRGNVAVVVLGILFSKPVRKHKAEALVRCRGFGSRGPRVGQLLA